MKTRKLIIRYDYYILSTYIVLMIFGLIMQLNISAVRTSMLFFYKQTIWFLLSIISVWFAFKVVNLKKIRKYIFLLIVLNILLLILVLIAGVNVKGGIRSLRILGINIQPSLIARVLLILYCAHILDKKRNFIKSSNLKGFFFHFNSLILIPLMIFILIISEKHFTPLIISSITLLSMFFLANIRFLTIAVMLVCLLIAGFIVINYGHDFRSERMEIYSKYSLFNKIFDKESDYEGTKDYQIKEGLISLSSGKLFGTTPQKGTGKHYFLPEAKTDYVFAIIGEEYGFMGSLIIISLFVFLFTRSLINAQKKENLYLKLAGFGLGMNIFFNAMVNFGVAMSALPSTGVTLPFISYGGTSLLINSFTVGLLLNISAVRRSL